MQINLKAKLIGIVLILFVTGRNVTISQETAKDSVDIFEMSIESLLDMQVTTVSKSEEKQSDAPGVITVLTKDEIKRFGGTTLASVLERVPGLTASTNYMSDRSLLASRGEQVTATSSHVLLLINGRPVREILEGGINSEMYETFPVNIIERIEVIKGPGSVLYGSNAFSGVINIITQKAEKTGGSVAAQAGPDGTYGTFGDIKIKAGDFSLVAAARYLKKPDWKVDFSRTIGASVYTRELTIPNSGPGAYFSASYKNLTLMSSYNQWENVGFPSRGTGPIQWKKNFNNLSYDFKVGTKWRSSINVGYTNSKLDADSFPKIHRNSYELLAEWTNFFTLTEKSKIVFGGLYMSTKGKEYNTLTGAEVVSSDTKRGAYGFYAQADYLLLKDLKLIGGIQLNKIENVDLGIVPRIGAIWNPTKSVNIKALYSKAFRAPSINEVSLVHPTMRGNPDLKPEKVGTIDISVGYLNEKMQIRVNYFYSNLYDMIIANRALTPALYANLGEANIYGFEFEGKYFINKNIYLSGSMLYQASEDTSGKENIVPIANLGVKGGISYQSDNGITLGLFDIYQGALDDRYKSTLNTSPEKAYNKLSLHLDFDLNKLFTMKLKQNFSLYVHADNLLDKKIWLPSLGAAPGLTVPFDQGRVMYAGLSVSF